MKYKTPIINWELYHHNYKALAKAIQKAGGDPFIVLNEHENFLKMLTNNNIEVQCLYCGLEVYSNETSEEKETINSFRQQLLNENL